MDNPFVAAGCARALPAVSCLVCYNAPHSSIQQNHAEPRVRKKEKTSMASRRTAIGLIAMGLLAIATIGGAHVE
jgi:uncharacterized membrane protein YidH (DUF202 family)